MVSSSSMARSLTLIAASLVSGSAPKATSSPSRRCRGSDFVRGRVDDIVGLVEIADGDLDLVADRVPDDLRRRTVRVLRIEVQADHLDVGLGDAEGLNRRDDVIHPGRRGLTSGLDRGL